jgi:hypothetical protein
LAADVDEFTVLHVAEISWMMGSQLHSDGVYVCSCMPAWVHPCFGFFISAVFILWCPLKLPFARVCTEFGFAYVFHAASRET